MKSWTEEWVERMGRIVALSGQARFDTLNKMKSDMADRLTPDQITQVRTAIRQRFTPTNGEDGCREAMQSVREM